GVHRVQTLDEMADTMELFSAARRAAAGGLAAIHDSGGERAQLIDAAEEAGLPLARISPYTEARLAAVLEEGLPPVNPLDAWGTATTPTPSSASACVRSWTIPIRARSPSAWT